MDTTEAIENLEALPDELQPRSILFDSAQRRVCEVATATTNTPLHALTLMNDTTFVEAARVFAERIIKQGGKSPDERLAMAFRMATARHPTARERETLVQVFQAVRQKYESNRESSTKLVSVGERPRDESLNVVELAAYSSVTNLILNLDEVITKE